MQRIFVTKLFNLVRGIRGRKLWTPAVCATLMTLLSNGSSSKIDGTQEEEKKKKVSYACVTRDGMHFAT